MTDDIIERLSHLHVWPQSIASTYADTLTPRQIERLYDVGNVATDAANEIASLRKQLENAREALANRDNYVSPCPADKTSLGDKLCPKCGSSSAGPCWLKVVADGTFVDNAREALKGKS